jgi:hypothetical protein
MATRASSGERVCRWADPRQRRRHVHTSGSPLLSMNHHYTHVFLSVSLSMLRPLKGMREMRFRVRRAAVHTIFVCPRKACNRLMHFDGRCHFWLVSTQVGTCIGGLGLHRLNIHEQAKWPGRVLFLGRSKFSLLPGARCAVWARPFYALGQKLLGYFLFLVSETSEN